MVRPNPNPSPEELAYASITQYIAEPNSFQVGGTGSLYVAQHRPTNELVAIKVIPLSDLKLRKTFDNEVKALQTMKKSLYTVHLRESFEYNGRGYIVMDLLSQDLYTRSEQFESIKEVRDIFFQVCDGVQELHKHKIAHLDLKPENILLDQHDNIKICDLGGSFLWKRTPEHFGFVGSDFYLAPEIFAHERGYNASKADVWSLGIMLYVLLTGAFPFGGNTKEQTMSNYFASCLCFSEFDSLYPHEVACRDLLARMLSRNPLNRPSVSDVLCHPWFQVTPRF